MGIFGALAGGSLGFMLGGPLGTLLGSVLGARVEEAYMAHKNPGLEGRARFDPRQAQVAFVVALSSLAAKVAKADGRVTRDEIEAFDGFLRQSLQMGVADREFAARIFNEARDSATSPAQFANQLGQIFRRQPDRLRDVLTILLSVAHADGHIHRKEEELIQSIGRDMGLSAADFQSCKSTFFATHGIPESSAYEVLGVSETSSDQELKAAHRRLVREYHPDVLQAKGMPEEFMAFASKKLVAVNEAWSRIKRERNL